MSVETNASKIRPGAPRTAVTFEAVQAGVFNYCRTTLAPELVDRYALANQRWQYVTDGKFPTFIGGDKRNSEIDDAVTTLDLSLGGVRFAAVGPDSRGSQRIVAVHWSGPEFKALAMDVSVSRNEVPDQFVMRDEVWLNNTHIMRVPTDPAWPHT